MISPVKFLMNKAILETVVLLYVAQSSHHDESCKHDFVSELTCEMSPFLLHAFDQTLDVSSLFRGAVFCFILSAHSFISALWSSSDNHFHFTKLLAMT
jgi:hypothetical protein